MLKISASQQSVAALLGRSLRVRRVYGVLAGLLNLFFEHKSKE
jgi:hypothetical protein